MGMIFNDVITSRRSVRAYRGDAVEPEKLQTVLQAAQAAPTACNLQPWRIVVLHTQGREQDLLRAYRGPWLAQAPLVLCFCALPDKAWRQRSGKNYVDVDVTIAADHAILAATDQGLGTCWIAAFDPAAVKEVFQLEQGWEPVVLTPLGYPDEKPEARPRQELVELVKYL
jgi:nitroreductase